jgi:N-methylhydantoinase B/oxoprolinase/acetone carboxylase alpha subunit
MSRWYQRRAGSRASFWGRPGSGGFIAPAERDPALVSEDVADGYVSKAAARREYGTEPKKGARSAQTWKGDRT